MEKYEFEDKKSTDKLMWLYSQFESCLGFVIVNLSPDFPVQKYDPEEKFWFGVRSHE